MASDSLELAEVGWWVVGGGLSGQGLTVVGRISGGLQAIGLTPIVKAGRIRHQDGPANAWLPPIRIIKISSGEGLCCKNVAAIRPQGYVFIPGPPTSGHLTLAT